jgi:hypothetical protein
MNDRLEDEAVKLDPNLDAEQKAAKLTPELRRQAEESERKERDDDLDSASSAPSEASPGVAEHEREMVRRGFERGGPPE